jgi:hypothetical protein
LFAQLNRYQIGRTGRLFLVRNDGMDRSTRHHSANER